MGSFHRFEASYEVMATASADLTKKTTFLLTQVQQHCLFFTGFLAKNSVPGSHSGFHPFCGY